MSRSAAVCVLSWNGRHHLELCLEALDAQLDHDLEWEVLVLDNGSSDDTRSWLEREWSESRRLGVERNGRLRHLYSESNLGFCGGCNLLGEAARAADHDTLIFLNNDTRPVPAWLGELTEALAVAPDDVAAVSGLIVDWEGERLDFARGAMTFDGHAFQRDFRRPLAELELPDDGEELLFACGGNMAIRRRAFERVGRFAPDYFAYLEDVDLGWRLWAAGERVTLARGARVHHRSMATSALLGLFDRGFLFERNAFLTAYKNYDGELWGRMMPVALLTLMARTRTLIERNNPGGGQITVDPYAIDRDPGTDEAPSPPPPTLWQKWRGWGTRELARRAVHKARRLAAERLHPEGGLEVPMQLDDPRTIAQLRALHWILANLEKAARQRNRVQANRVRSDREIFERFPLLLVPTYPGDDTLFASPGFQAWLPEDLPLEWTSLEALMNAG